MSHSRSTTLTSSEWAVYQSLVARGLSRSDALDHALDGVTIEDARNFLQLGPSQAEVDEAIRSIRSEL